MNNIQHRPGYYLEKGYILLFALLPWSVDWGFGSWSLSIPSEPLILLLGLGLIWEVARSGRMVSLGLPLKISLLWILWMAISAAFSTMPLVSWKYWIVEAGHWWVFAAGMALWPGLWLRVLPYFVLSMIGLTAYTVIHHGFFDFRADQALLAPMPFFPDHTMYAAVLAMLIFLVQIPFYVTSSAARFLQKPVFKNTVSIAFFAAIILSSCRAALLSLGIAGLVWAVFVYREKWRYLVAGTLLLALISVPFVAGKLSRSVANDVSIQERLNRWDCAGSMLAARPLVGFGPGTFQFQYLAFQKPENMTRISVQDPLMERGPDTYGRGGGAHSEYGQAAAEMGWPGLLLWLGLVSSALWAGFRKALIAPSKVKRQVALFLALGLLTYFLHGLGNNFLHDGRVAALVWGGMGWLGNQK